ncbi:MAG: HEAT repeat domain-containing protein, partial [Planctomycetes bacterium]|nr:HEAT repeat domain-containing protein [Planctomycetota bacterium]
ALAAKGSRDEAIAIYDRMRNLQPGPQQVRAGGLRGAILTRQKDGIPLMVEALRGNDLVLFNAAIRAAIEMKGPDVVKALADGLPKLAADKQFVVISALGKLGDVAALPAILAAAKAGDKTVRLAAIGAIPEIGSAAAVPGLVTLMTDAEADVAKAAQTALAGMPGAEVDKAVAGMLTNADAKVRATGIDLLGQRRTATAMPALLKAAEDADEAVRAAGLKVLGELGGEAQMQPVLGLLLKAKSPADVQAAEGALGAICSRLSRPVLGNVVIVKAVYGDLPDGASADVTQKVAEMVKNGVTAVEASNANFGDPADGSVKKLRIDYTVDGKAATGTAPESETVAILARVAPPACTDALCAAATQAKGQAKLALLRILAKGGGAKALDLVRAASKDADTEVKDGALRALCDWSTIEALPDLATLAKSADKKVKTLALRGYIRLIPLQDGPAEKKVAALKEAMDLADRKEEKRLVLAALGGIPTVESLALVTPHLEGADLKEEASAAAVAIAEKIVQSSPAQVAAAMEQVTKATTNDRVLKKAKTLLGQAKAKPAK